MATNNPTVRGGSGGGGRSNGQVTKREFDAFTLQVFNRLDEISKQMQQMLPREIYEVRHKQVVEDTEDHGSRLTAAEKAITDLMAQLATVKLSTGAQINSEVRPVERNLTELRYETTKRALDLMTRVFFAVGGAVAAWIVYHAR